MAGLLRQFDGTLVGLRRKCVFGGTSPVQSGVWPSARPHIGKH